jgi:hypothetical protein
VSTSHKCCSGYQYPPRSAQHAKLRICSYKCDTPELMPGSLSNLRVRYQLAKGSYVTTSLLLHCSPEWHLTYRSSFSSTVTISLEKGPNSPATSISSLEAQKLEHLEAPQDFVRTASSVHCHHGSYSAKFAGRKTGKARLKRSTDCSCL